MDHAIYPKFGDADIAAIMGGNVRDLLLASLPD